VRSTIDPGRVKAVLFDMDGVVTDTMRVHFAAWKRLFDDVLRRQPPGSRGLDPFTEEDYLRHVDGRRREDGVAAFLGARGVQVPWGDEDDGPDRETVVGLGRRKNSFFLDAVRANGVLAYPSTVRLVTTLQEAGVGTALITASRNAGPVLRSAGIDGLFPVLVDGDVASELGLPGKPDPAIFLEAARRLGTSPADSAVVEDAIAGVEAARRGGFVMVIAVDRTGHDAPLREAGAHVVVRDLSEVAVGTGVTT
jgi:beta-phosphoglucomutase family hydrolase